MMQYSLFAVLGQSDQAGHCDVFTEVELQHFQLGVTVAGQGRDTARTNKTLEYFRDNISCSTYLKRCKKVAFFIGKKYSKILLLLSSFFFIGKQSLQGLPWSSCDIQL